MTDPAFSPIRSLAMAHGLFFLAFGLWPVADIKSFEKATGPKTDDWLVKTVGWLLAVTGATLAYSGARRKEIPSELALVAAGESLVLGAVSGYYSSRGRISKIYLADAATEGALVAAWAWARKRKGLRVA